MIHCPNCGMENNESEMMCYSCGEDLDGSPQEKPKGSGFKNRRRKAVQAKQNNPLEIMEDQLIVEQQVEWMETFTDFETENRYTIYDANKRERYFAEEKSSMLSRFFIPSGRPLDIEVYNLYGEQVMALHKPFRFFISEIEIYNERDQTIGNIKKKFWALRRTYLVYDMEGNEAFRIIGPLLKPWTFKIMKEGQEIGRISKKWSGGMKEMFTDADTFHVNFPQGATDEEKKIFLGATFLIDFLHFENGGSRD